MFGVLGDQAVKMAEGFIPPACLEDSQRQPEAGIRIIGIFFERFFPLDSRLIEIARVIIKGRHVVEDFRLKLFVGLGP